MSKQIEVLIKGQSKNIAPSRTQVEEALSGHDVISVLQVCSAECLSFFTCPFLAVSPLLCALSGQVICSI